MWFPMPHLSPLMWLFTPSILMSIYYMCMMYQFFDTPLMYSNPNPPSMQTTNKWL